MDLTHIRNENGTTTLITRQQAADEIDSAISGPTRKDVDQMSASRTGANLHYRDGRTVEIRQATPDEIAEHSTPALSYTVIYTGGGEPVVHRTGCSHNLRDSGRGAHRTQVIAGTIDDVCREVFSDFLSEDDDPSDFYGDLNVKPCAR
ncbi:hypothetical protein ACGF07_25665 [Kitasatospora sp. NPDC048194]|uniref:hypothetical protein n=1 Tax=Kitasatospora sp. NPDC048194 TaxID=3364045 RepID=UPI00371FD2EA